MTQVQAIAIVLLVLLVFVSLAPWTKGDRG